MSKPRRTNLSSDSRVLDAREKVREAYKAYHQHTENNSEAHKKAKEHLEKAYNAAIEEDLSSKLHEVEIVHVKSQHGLSWRLINDITCRKASKKGQMKGNTQEERVANWYIHFRNFLGSPPDIEDEDEELAPILDELNISIGPFSREEYDKTKASLVEGKSCGEDGIPPEVLKRCNLDELCWASATTLCFLCVYPSMPKWSLCTMCIDCSYIHTHSEWWHIVMIV